MVKTSSETPGNHLLGRPRWLEDQCGRLTAQLSLILTFASYLSVTISLCTGAWRLHLIFLCTYLGVVLFLLRLCSHYPTTRYGIPDSLFSSMTDRFIGAPGVLDLGRLYIIPWPVRILRLSVGRLVLPTYIFGGFVFKDSFSSTLLSPIYSTGGLCGFSKVRTHLIEVNQRLHPSFFVRLSFTLDIHWIIVVPRTISSHLAAFSTRFYPALETTAMLTLSTRATSFILINNTRPVVPLPPNGHYTLRALLFRLTFNVDHHSARIWRR